MEEKTRQAYEREKRAETHSAQADQLSTASNLACPPLGLLESYLLAPTIAENSENEDNAIELSNRVE